jgi:hypothetical protein
VTFGRLSRSRWVRLTDPIFRTTHLLVSGPPEALPTVLRTVLTSPEWTLFRTQFAAEVLMVKDSHGRVLFTAPGNDEFMLSVIWVNAKQADPLSTFVHEIGHATDYVMHYRGLAHHINFAETWRYYNEWLFGARKGLGL